MAILFRKLAGISSVLKLEQNFLVCYLPILFPSISHKITIRLPPTGHELFGSKLQLSNLQTIAPTGKTFKCRSFGPTLSLLKQILIFQVSTIVNGGPQLPQCSPMGPNFFLAAKWSTYAGIWAYEPGRLFLKA